MVCAGLRGRWIIVLAIVLLPQLVSVTNAPRALAQDNPLTLITKALQLTREGKIDDAIAVQKRVIPALEKMVGKRNPLYPMQIALLGQLYGMKQDYAQAERLQLEALSLREQLLGPEHADVAASLAQLADIYIATANYPKADAALQRVLAIQTKVLPESHHDYAGTYLSLGKLNVARSRFADAEQNLRRALNLLERHQKPDHPYLPLARTNLAEALRALGQYDEAERLARDALAANERLHGSESFVVATNLNNLSQLFNEQGRIAEAEQLGRRAVAIIEKTLGPDHPTIAGNLNNLALFLVERGRAAEAVALMQRSLAIQRKTHGAEHPLVATALHNLGEALARTDKTAEAESHFRQALAMRERVSGPRDLSVASSLNSIVTFLNDQDRYAEAEPFGRRALAIRSEALHPGHPARAFSLANLGIVLDRLGRHAEARPLHEQALAIMEKAYGRDHPSYAAALGRVGGNLGDSGDWTAAYGRYREANRIWIGRRAAMLASGPSEAGTEADTELRANTGSFFGQIRTGYELWRAAPDGEKPALMEQSFAAHQWGLLSSAASALNKMTARIAARSGPLSDLVREQQDLAAQLGALDKSLVAALSSAPGARGPEGEADLRKRSEAARARLGTLAAELSRRFPDFAALASPSPAGLADVRRALKPNEALYTIAVGWRGSYSWVITPDAERWVRIERTESQLKDDVAALRCGLDAAAWEAGSACPKLTGRSFNPDEAAGGGQPPFDVARAHALYQALFGGVVDLIKDRQLIVVPAGPLAQLPFHVLIAGDADPAGDGPDVYRRAEWLARRNAITVLPAVSSLIALRRNAGASAAALPYLGFGNPVLDGPDKRYAALAARTRSIQNCTMATGAGPRIAALSQRATGKVTTTLGLADISFMRTQAPLPETADELCTVASVLKAPADAVMLGSAATETNLKRMNEGRGLTRYRVLHFATHGVLAGDAVGISEPGLLFTPPAKATDADDGYLSAAEISGLELDADLVILSACNTAAGGAGDTDALAGLARSFFYSGARALFVSHWAVNSDATVHLITKALATAGQSPATNYAQALQQAMVTLIDGNDPAAAHPAFWAPFVVVGVEAAK